ncbi:ABC transporter permease [Demequina activiva]|uniref:ABC transporter permease n=1 Tax=Demequina activiva TaxID=1582364 RepID=A0A919Q2U9_9MICO|nr:ABC transporter permease subunit [Demequina activiva]GIG55230.1 ABC transporter permease [Demequina activiva]
MPRAVPPWAAGLIGAVAIVSVWWVIGAIAQGRSGETAGIPTPPQVAQSYAESGWAFYWNNFSVTLNEAAQGYLWGNGLALLLSAFVLVVPRLEGVVMQLAVVSYCIPIVAIGPLLLLILGIPAPGEPSSTAIFLAAMSVFFTTVVGSLLGLKSADKASLDVVSVYGGSRFTQLRKVRLISALPAVLTALQIAVPAAFLGAILGEYLGKVEVGVGPAMVIAQQSLNAPRVWAIALASGAVALIAYLLVGMLTRLSAPWARGVAA